MAFALTSFFADGTRFAGPGPYRATQTYVFTITGLTTDVDLDIGDASGTFWTAAIANTTYGEMATQVLAQIVRLEAQISAVKGIYTPQLAARIQAAAASGTAYTLSINTSLTLPDYTFAASNGETAYTVFVEFLLIPNALPTNLSYNIG